MHFFKDMASALVAGVIFAGTVTASAEAPSNYYSSCENKGGRSLLESLSAVVNGHTNVGYDGLWNVYKTSDVRANGKVWDMYSTKEWTVGQQRCGNYTYVGDCINREHSMPKSWFSDASPMKSDAFHVYPTDGKVNGQRSNFPYGECSGGTTLPSNNGVKALGRLGTSTFPGYSGKVFEPDDQYKGDFARSYFYMAACYYDRIAGWSSPMLAGNNYPAFSSWAVDLLLKWHRQDPVSEKERVRNDAVYAHQRNRNPFIDYPDMVEYIWGDKTSQKWSAQGEPDPEINSPVSGSTVDLGLTAKNISVSREIAVKTTAAAADVSVVVSGAGFSVSPASLPASSANSESGAVVTVSYISASTGDASGTLTVASGGLTATVALHARVVDGLPAGPAAEITDNSFLAVWTYIGDADASGNYTLTVSDASGILDGYPRQVPAADGKYLVEGLQNTTAYTYTVASTGYVSDPVAVTTSEPVPAIDFLFDGQLYFTTLPGEPSEVAELLIETDNVDGDFSVVVESPFQISTDKTSWSEELILSPDEDRMYMRLYTHAEGTYTTSVTAIFGDFIFDDAEAQGKVAATASFIEDFEAGTTGSYTKTEFHGDACAWTFSDTGVWPENSSNTYSGENAARFGKTSSSSIEMAEDKVHGAGELRFFARAWSAKDGDADLDVLVSTDGGANYTKAGTFHIGPDAFRECRLSLLTPGNIRIKLQQTSGARLLVDHLSISDYTSGLEFPDADYHAWDAYSCDGSLVVEARHQIEAAIYGIDGITYFSGSLPEGIHTFGNLPQGQLYIVVSGDFSRRVLVK